MKKRFFLTVLLTIATIALGTLTLVACNHTHTVNKWNVVKESTCTTEGLKRGACSDCGEVIEEPVPVNPDNHVYGNWEVSVMPTADLRNGTGQAKRTCTENPDHYITEILPSLIGGGKAYKSYEVSKEATVLEEGEVHAVYESQNGYGDISVIITTAKKKFDPTASVSDGVVEDAVLMAYSGHDDIRSGSGNFYNTLDGKGSVSYVYGEDYLYADDGSDEWWYSLDSKGNIFCISKLGTNDPIKYADATLRNLDGYRYNYRSSGEVYYGAEGLLYGTYLAAKSDANSDFRVWKTEDELTGETYYCYSYGMLAANNRFIKYSVKFSLDENNLLSYVKVESGTYFSQLDKEGKYSEEGQFYVVYDNDTKKSTAILYTNAGAPTFEEYVEYYQTSKIDSPEEPVHENTEEAFIITGFNLYKDNVLLKDTSTPLTFNAGGGQSNLLTLNIRAITPSTASFVFDPVELYMVTDSGRKIALTSSPDSTRKVYYSMSKVGSRYYLNIYSKRSGVFNLMLITESGYEKSFSVEALPVAPTSLVPSVYRYSDSGYSWEAASESDTVSAEIYVGQPLEMKASPLMDEKEYVDASYTVSVNALPDGITADMITLTVDEETSVVRFASYYPGDYQIVLISSKDTSKYALVDIKVNAAPDLATILTGKYSGNLKKGPAEITFLEKDADGNISVKIETNQGEEILSVYYDEEKRSLVSSHLSGAPLGAKLEINEAYKLVLAYPTGFGSGKERIVLQVVTEESATTE